VIIITLGVLTLLIIFFIALPIFHSRPIIIQRKEELILVLLLSAILALWLHPIVFALALVIATVIYYNDHWILLGVSRENVMLALQKAVVATRSESRVVENSIQINGEMLVKTHHFGKSFAVLRYTGNTQTNSKRTKLTKNVLYKFINNYKFNQS